MGKQVVLISEDQKLGSILMIALVDPGRLVTVGAASELPEGGEEAIEAIVLDLPLDSRRRAYAEVRERFAGRVLVPVDTGSETSDWPPDPDRHVLVRPFHLADLIAGVQGPDRPQRGEAEGQRRRSLRRLRSGVPWPVPARGAGGVAAAPPAAEPAPGPAAGRRPRRVAGTATAALAVLLAGIGAGMLLKPDPPRPASEAPGPVVRQLVVTRPGPAPSSCTAAVDDADATISYLIAKIRDGRLRRSLAQYTSNSQACRQAGR